MVCLCMISALSVNVWRGRKVVAPYDEPDIIDMIKVLLRVKFGHSIHPHFDVADIDIVMYCVVFFFFF